MNAQPLPDRPSHPAVSEFERFDAVELGELVRRREVSPKELVQAAIERIERINPRLNAVITPMFDYAREAATALEAQEPTSPLFGVPYLLKDLFAAQKGFPTTCGSRYYQHFVPDYDDELVTRYKRAGLICLGKTNTPEFGLLPVTEPELTGVTENPWKLGKTAGGSSGGSAAAIAAGMVPVAHGSDGGGSLRIPASCCGIVGFKPTRARTPVGPDDSEFWLGFATGHALSRTVRDNAAMLDAVVGPESIAQYWAPPGPESYLADLEKPVRPLRIAFWTQPLLPGHTHSDCVGATEEAAKLCEELGHHVEEAGPKLDAKLFATYFFTLICGATASALVLGERAVGRRAERRDVETTTWLMALLGRQFSGADMFSALSGIHEQARIVHRFMENYDVLLTPTLGWPPVRHGKLRPKGAEATVQEMIATLNLGSALKVPRIVEITVNRVFNFIPFTPVFNVTGQPSISLPLHWNREGLPIGTMFTGRFGEDSTILRLSRQLEEARPWRDKHPPISAF